MPQGLLQARGRGNSRDDGVLQIHPPIQDALSLLGGGRGSSDELLAERGIVVSHETKRFFRKLLKGQGTAPWWLVTDKLRSYSAAHGSVMPAAVHDTGRYVNNRGEVTAA